MSDEYALFLFFGLLFIVAIGLLLKDHIGPLKIFFEDPKEKVRKRFERGELTEEEYRSRIKHLESCG